ncbi:hypothetical protein HDU89_006414 [Geranomyces variabilis]|nr:hypothetical protein HDU89_006414 [Geranomyces variabilis]
MEAPSPALPHEIWLKILHKLPGPALALTRSVSRAWRIRANDPILWRALCWNARIDTSRYVVKRCGEDEDDGGPRLTIDWLQTFAAHTIRDRNRAKRYWASHHECNGDPSPRQLTVDPTLRRVMVLVPPAPCEQCIIERTVWSDLGWGVDNVDIPIPWVLGASPTPVNVPPPSPAATTTLHSSRPLLSRASALMHTLTSGCEFAAGLKDLSSRFHIVSPQQSWMEETTSGFRASVESIEEVFSMSPPSTAGTGGFSELARQFSRISVGGGDGTFPRYLP